MSIQDDLDELSSLQINFPKEPLEEFASQFEKAFIVKHKKHNSFLLRIWAIPKGTSFFCPRDSDNAWLAYNNKVKQGYEICEVCKNNLICMTTGTTKSFELMQ